MEDEENHISPVEPSNLTATLTIDQTTHPRDIPHHQNNIDHSEDNRAKHFNRGQQKSICWFNPPCEPLTWEYYVSVRGQDGFHVYLWIMKDLSWVQAWYYPGLVFGTLTLVWSAFMLWRACWRKSLDEVWTHSAQFMWLFGNFLWMQGELHDNQYPNEPSQYNERADQGGYIFIAALIWISIYYCIAKPLNITSSREVNAPYDTTGFKCRFPYFFQSWREYENVHILFWIGKDCFWCWYIDYMWVIFFIPTLLIAFDFCYVSLRGKNMVIDHAHYVSQLLWVSANATWGAGEFWFSVNHDSALSMTSWNKDVKLTFRWYSAWVVVSAYVPLIILYLIWIPSTIMGRIEDDDEVRQSLAQQKSTSSSINSSSQQEQQLQQQQMSSSFSFPFSFPFSSSSSTSASIASSSSTAATSSRESKPSLFQQTYGRIRAWSGTSSIQMTSSSTPVESHQQPHANTSDPPNTHSNHHPATLTTNLVTPTYEINPIRLGDDNEDVY